MVTNKKNNGVKGVRDVLGADKIEFYPDLERHDKTFFLESNFVIDAVKLVEDWDSEFGTSSFYLVKLTAELDGKSYTCIMSGKAIMKQLRKLNDARRFPVAASLKINKSAAGNEYFFLDNPIKSEEEPF